VWRFFQRFFRGTASGNGRSMSRGGGGSYCKLPVLEGYTGGGIHFKKGGVEKNNNLIIIQVIAELGQYE
jgi:hypothetical protein